MRRCALACLALAAQALRPHQHKHRPRLRAAADEEQCVVSFAVRRPPRAAEATEPSPLRGGFVADDELVLAAAVAREGESGPAPRAYPLAGPRELVARVTRAGVVTCGGLCPGLNAVVQEVHRTLARQYGVEVVLGARGGYGGVAAGRWEDLGALLGAQGAPAYRQGGTLLGTSRPRAGAAALADALERARLDALFVAGGDGTMRGAQALCAELAARGSACRVAVVPKTIDNDIPLVDRSFGFDTAVAAAKDAIDVAVTEARAFPRGLGVVRLMGRDAGFLAAHAALAAPGDVDACLVPEQSFSLDALLAHLERRVDAAGHAVVVVAEGVDARVVDAEGASVSVAGDVGPWLCDRLRGHFDGGEREKVSLKYVDPGYAVRAGAANPADAILCSRLAQHAVHGVLGGRTAFAVGTVNAQFCELPLEDFADRASVCSVSGRLFGDLRRSTGQPDLAPPGPTFDAVCDNDLESPSGGCVVTWGGPTTTGVRS